MLIRDQHNGEGGGGASKRLSLKVSLDPAESLTALNGARHGVLTEGATAEVKLRSLVNEKLTCVPKNYKVGEAAHKGFFRSDQVTISKVDIDLQQQMKPYIYEIGSADEEEFDGDQRKRKGGVMDYT